MALEREPTISKEDLTVDAKEFSAITAMEEEASKCQGCGSGAGGGGGPGGNCQGSCQGCKK